MIDFVIIGVVAAVVALAVLSMLKKARTKASCCSGSAYVAKTRKLGAVAEKKTFRVEGMHCQHCANRVTEDVQDLPGVAASVNLKKGLVTVSMEQHVDDAAIVAAIEKHGYKVI